MSFAKAVGMLTLLGLASPFLAMADPMHGIIGLIILLVGMRIAWRLTSAKPLDISGPIPLVDRAPVVSG
jgi:cytochrome b561